MQIKHLIPTLAILLSSTICFAQEKTENPEVAAITKTINHYFMGTSNGEPERLDLAFHPDFNLYTVSESDSLEVVDGDKYKSYFEKGMKNERIGKIISIDFVKDIAVVKAEVLIPNWRVYTDYFMLLKYEGSWKIVQKSYTYEKVRQ